MRSFVAALLVASVAAADKGPIVLTGATGRTGRLIYGLLKSKGHDVRAFVLNATKAKDILNCSKCDQSEGIFVGDITKPDTLTAVMAGASALMIATSAAPTIGPDGKISFHKGAYPVDLDWHGAKNQLKAFAMRTNGAAPGSIQLISTEGTTTPENVTSKYFMDYISFYKLNFEAALMASGLPFTIIKPCGLDYGGTAPGKAKLTVGHDDQDQPHPAAIPRADVARVMVASVEDPELSKGLRFDLCSTKTGAPTTDADLPAVLKSARLPWQQSPQIVV